MSIRRQDMKKLYLDLPLSEEVQSNTREGKSGKLRSMGAKEMLTQLDRVLLGISGDSCARDAVS